MRDTPQTEYLKSKILTASPEQLQMMLYDGAIRFGEQARESLAAKDISTTHDRLLRAQRIVAELATSLKADLYPELCGKLASLYSYVYRRMVDANIQKDLSALDEALQLLRYQRDTWQMLVAKLRDEKSSVAGEPAPAAATAAELPAIENPVRPYSLPIMPGAVGKQQKGLQSLIGGTISLEG